MRVKFYLLAFFLIAWCRPAWCNIHATNPWYVLGYVGRTVTDDLADIIFRNHHNWEEHIIRSAEVGKGWFQIYGLNFETAFNFSEHIEKGRVDRRHYYSYNGFFALRFSEFPWNWLLYTTLAVGEGISYAQKIPQVEEDKQSGRGRNASRFLNFMIFEFTVGLPFFQNVQGYYRIHHRSGAFGTYNNVSGGANTLGGGLKILF